VNFVRRNELIRYGFGSFGAAGCVRAGKVVGGDVVLGLAVADELGCIWVVGGVGQGLEN
jgi:hypothetical protein